MLHSKLLKMSPLLQVFIGFLLLVSNSNTSDTVDSDEPQEVQHAVCKIFTKEIEATATATITRRLKGLHTNELQSKLDKVQEELNEIKQLLYTVLGKTYQTNDNLANTTLNFKTEKPSTESDYPDDDHWDGEQNEIALFNDTIVDSSEGSLYFYYWKILDIIQVLSKKNSYMSSPTFALMGHTLRVNFYPYYGNDCVAIMLKPDSNSFLKKHKIILLGQKNSQSSISSNLLYRLMNKEAVFKIQPEMLDDNFIFNNSLIVKVKIYLN